MSIQQQTASSLPVFTSRYLSFPISAKSVLVDAKSVLVSLWFLYSLTLYDETIKQTQGGNNQNESSSYLCSL